MDYQGLLDAIKTALGVIQTVAATPGVNVLPYVSTVAAAIGAIQASIKIGENVSSYIVDFKDTFAAGTPTPEKLAALDAKIAELQARVRAPLPPREGDEPE